MGAEFCTFLSDLCGMGWRRGQSYVFSLVSLQLSSNSINGNCRGRLSVDHFFVKAVKRAALIVIKMFFWSFRK